MIIAQVAFAETAKRFWSNDKRGFMKHILMTIMIASMSSAALAKSVEVIESQQFGAITPLQEIAIDKVTQFQEAENPIYDTEAPVEVKAKKPKILIAGDSWAFFTCVYNSMGKMIRTRQAPLSEDNRCWRTSKVGMQASDWEASRAHKRVIRYLQTTPRIKYLYLSLGGNDMMKNWNQEWTHEQELALFEKTTQTLQRIMNTYLAVRPDIKIVLAGYDFPNFTFKFRFPLYSSIHKRMGYPDPERMNRALIEFTQYVSRVGNNKNIFYIHSIGLAHYYDGVKEKGFLPHQTATPDQISPMDNPGAVGGNPTMQTSRKSMIHWLYIIRDAFHLNNRMYRNVMLHAYDNLISHLIERDQLQKQDSNDQNLALGPMGVPLVN